jgi:hypothetical protein
MKKYLLILVIALVVILAVPMMVSAQQDATVVVSGTLSTSFELTADQNTVSFPLFVTGENYAGPTLLTITTNDPSWTVNAADDNQGTGTGYMKSGSTALQDRFQLSPNTDGYDGLPYLNIATGIGSGTQDVYYSQNIESTDLAGSYNITVDFNGVPS